MIFSSAINLREYFNMKHFCDRSLTLAPDLDGSKKIKLSYIFQAFKLKEKASLSLFVFYIYMCFWISIIGFISYAIIALSLGQKDFLSIIGHLNDPILIKNKDDFSIIKSLSFLLFSSIASSLIIVISCGYLWRVHVGQKKRFFATFPKFSLCVKMFLFSLCYTILLIVVASLIFFGLFTMYAKFSLWLGLTTKGFDTKLLTYPFFAINAIVAIFYWLGCSYLSCILFKRYKQEKINDFNIRSNDKIDDINSKIKHEINSFLFIFKSLFKPFVKQSLRFSCVMELWYLIALSPFLILGPYFTNNNLTPKVVFWSAIVYLLLTPIILSTMFNLYLLCFQSIMNYKQHKINNHKADNKVEDKNLEKPDELIKNKKTKPKPKPKPKPKQKKQSNSTKKDETSKTKK